MIRGFNSHLLHLHWLPGLTTPVANLYASVSKRSKQWASTPMRASVREFDSHPMFLI